MSDMIQTLIVALIVLAAAAYVGRKLWRALHPKAAAGCASDCGCGADAAQPTDWAKS
jgi:hypothetical protein